ncbi:hypothetical protein ABGT15_04725 [Flavobacterium enshiense]|uniref:hypothetical protein n=1 Tax=Flavobacterium enshiense TaxID=1341165 RepID=UPI00345D26E0
MKKYTVIKWEKLLLWLIPPILRKKTHYDWLNTLLSPIRAIYEETLYKMQHTGQVIYLEKVLNEAFNPERIYNPNYTVEQKKSHQLIYIEETVKPTLHFLYLHEEYLNINIDKSFIYTYDELKSQGKKPLYLANKMDYTEMTYANFRVFIPEALNYSPPIELYGNEVRLSDTGGVVYHRLTLEELSKKLVFNSHPIATKEINGAIEVHTAKYHDLLNFYKLAGKTYESYSYRVKTINLTEEVI